MVIPQSLLSVFSRSHLKIISLGVFCSAIFMILISHFAVERRAKDSIHRVAKETPAHRVALVLGCAKYTFQDRENWYYTERMAAAERLYKEGRVKFFIVSGDNSRKDYDEPTDMKNDLMARGIPEDAIFCDYAGFRTLDSMIRADKVFGEKKFLVISQEFHVKRALYIAKQHHLEVQGFAANAVPALYSFKTKTREVLARVKMMLDLHLLHLGPKFLGPRVYLPS